jgi:hypothetical protein
LELDSSPWMPSVFKIGWLIHTKRLIVRLQTKNALSHGAEDFCSMRQGTTRSLM